MKIVHLTQGLPEWKTWRLQGLGGSDVAAIVGVSPYQDHTRAVVFAEKVHGIEREANFAMRRGNRLEPHARAAYERFRRCSAPPDGQPRLTETGPRLVRQKPQLREGSRG